jgi:hypothetical protein
MCRRTPTPTTSFTVFRSQDPELASLKRLEAALGLSPALVGFWTWIGAVGFPKAALLHNGLKMQDYDQWTDVDPEVTELLEHDV